MDKTQVFTMDKATFNRMKELEAQNDLLRVEAHHWKHTAEILALDLGHPEYAQEIYKGVRDGIYDKVRQRLRDDNREV